MTQDTIQFSKVFKKFGHKDVLKNFSLTISAHESFTLMGRSGSGKSVALKCLLGLISHDKGFIQRGERTITRLSEGKHREHMEEVGVVFQGSALFDSMTVGENILFAFNPFFQKNPEIEKNRVLETLKQVGLNPDIYHLLPSEISGGMAKRAAIARAIIQKPKFLFLDEPTTGLDPVSSLHIAELIRSLHAKGDMTTFTITHDLHLAHTISDRMGVLDGGKLFWSGSFSDMKASKNSLIRKLLNAQKLS